MSSSNQNASNQRWLLKIFAFIILSLLFLARIGYGQTQVSDLKNIVLQGSINIEPIKIIPSDEKNKIQPGTQVKISVTVENKGQLASAPGQLYVVYAFPQPLESEESSIIFETEKQLLPSIEPNQKINIVFDTTHHIPSILDFVRYDWLIREYQAITIFNDEDSLIGTLAITFSAYYYPGIKKELPKTIK